MSDPVIYWFRNDLRLADLPGLSAAVATGQPVIVCYVLDELSAGDWSPGAASRWWLHHSLDALACGIAALGGRLTLLRGAPNILLPELVRTTGASTVFCSRQYEPSSAALEHAVEAQLAEHGAVLSRHSGTLLFEPKQLLNKAGLPFKVFTPFWKTCRAQPAVGEPGGDVVIDNWYTGKLPGDSLSDWSLRPEQPDWALGWQQYWQPGSPGAALSLKRFLHQRMESYSRGRDYPAQQTTSGLSPHLHFGEIAPARVFCDTLAYAAKHSALEGEADKFLSELGWREFSHHLLFHFPTLPEQPFKPVFAAFPWCGSPQHFNAWKKGETGYPLVDAGMRELWQTGYMHNRVRMITASFLTKHLLIDWRAGQRWFFDTLVDADLANNAAGWQWVAGSGADASPYFRIFNPIIQGEKFDRDGAYIRRWLPELSALPDRYLNCPWTAPESVLEASGVALGVSYPAPIVDHRAARESALLAYASIRGD